MRHSIETRDIHDNCESSNNQIKNHLVDSIRELGDFSFSDNSWYYSKLHEGSALKGTHTIAFHKVPLTYIDATKYYVLLKGGNPNTIQKKVLKIADFLCMLIINFNGIRLRAVTYKHVNAFEQRLLLSDDSMSTKRLSYNSVQDFFLTLTEIGEGPLESPTKTMNPFKQVRSTSKERYIPEAVIGKLDQLFYDDQATIPLEFRLLYWLIRSFPNRINEVLSMRINCLSSYNDLFFIEIPMYKQKGSTSRPELKKIPVTNINHGKYVLSLLNKWIVGRKKMIVSSEPLNKEKFKENLLFITKRWKFDLTNNNLSVKAPNTLKAKNHMHNMDLIFVNKRLKELCELFGFEDANNHSLKITSHYFRHNAITDRLYIPNYTSEQLSALTGHKNENMLQYYTHQKKEIHQKISEDNHNETDTLNFSKIIKFNQFNMEYLKNLGTCYGLTEIHSKKGLGICANITNCRQEGLPVRFCCYFCEWFHANPIYETEYKQELEYWETQANAIKSGGHIGSITLIQVDEIINTIKKIVKSIS